MTQLTTADLTECTWHAHHMRVMSPCDPGIVGRLTVDALSLYILRTRTVPQLRAQIASDAARDGAK